MKKTLILIILCSLLMGCGNKAEVLEQPDYNGESKDIVEDTKDVKISDDSYNGEVAKEDDSYNGESDDVLNTKDTNNSIFVKDLDSGEYELNTVTLSYNNEDILNFTNPSIFHYITVEKDGEDIEDLTNNPRVDYIHISGLQGSTWTIKVLKNGFEENTSWLDGYTNGYNSEHDMYRYVSMGKTDNRDSKLNMTVDNIGICSILYYINIDSINYIEISLATRIKVEAKDMTENDVKTVMENIMKYIEFI